MEEWLRAGRTRQAQSGLDAEIEAYYLSLESGEEKDHRAITRAAARAARRLRIDDGSGR